MRLEEYVQKIGHKVQCLQGQWTQNKYSGLMSSPTIFMVQRYTCPKNKNIKQ